MAVGRIVAGIFILSLLAVTESLKEECDPPDCSDKENYDKVPDSYNCTNYYICFDKKPTDHPVPCPSGGTFDPTEGECGPLSDPPCTPACSGGDISKCNVACTDSVTRINDPSNCGTYYNCESSVPGPAQQCKDINPYYDSKTDKCSTDKSVCCEFTCDPVCIEVKTSIPDYYDSSQYYMCMNVGIPSEDFHFQCPQDEYFDVSLGKCAPIVKWESSCFTSSRPSSIVTAPVTPSSIVTGSTTPSSIVTAPVTPSSIVTGSTSLSSIVTSPVTTTSGCMDSMTCAELGYLPKCNYCNPEFFFCEQLGKPAVLQKCTGVLLFSPTQHLCVLPAGCT